MTVRTRASFSTTQRKEMEQASALCQIQKRKINLGEQSTCIQFSGFNSSCLCKRMSEPRRMWTFWLVNYRFHGMPESWTSVAAMDGTRFTWPGSDRESADGAVMGQRSLRLANALQRLVSVRLILWAICSTCRLCLARLMLS